MALDQSALIDMLGQLKQTDVTDRENRVGPSGDYKPPLRVANSDAG
jgi:hypothetical protein